jgi:Ca2+-dependent lipid-binding protein
MIDSYNPTWMETKFLLVNSLTESLVLSLYDWNDVRSNTLLGAATFDLAALQEDASQEGITKLVLKDGKERGEMKFDINFYPVLTPKSENGGTELPETSIFLLLSTPH